jgi:DNA-binding NarL/FixJ family response regulator
LRAGLRAILSSTPDINIVGEAQDGFEAKKLVDQLRPKILLLDLKMPGPPPAEIEKWVRSHCPETTTLVLTAHDRSAYLAEMMEAGVAGFLTKDSPSDRLIEAIRRAAGGNVLFTIEQIERVRRWRSEIGSKLESLTKREWEVLMLVKCGRTNYQIADELRITETTVRFHLRNIYEKIHVCNRAEAVKWVMQFGRKAYLKR